MKCEDAGEFVSALHDGEKIPREAAQHLSECEVCRMRLSAYSGIGTELGRAASLEGSGEVTRGLWAKERKVPLNWWQKGRETMRIPRFAFALMLAVIFLLSGSLYLVRARPGASGPVLWLTSKLPPNGEVLHCAMETDGEPGKPGLCKLRPHT